MFKLSVLIDPVLAERWGKFKRMKRAYRSFWVLAVLFLLSLPAELVFSDKPLVMNVDDNWYFPAFKDYTYADFGGSSEQTVENYRGTKLGYALRRIKRTPNPEVLFGCTNEFISDSELLLECKAVETALSSHADTRKLYTYEPFGTPQKVKLKIYPFFRYAYDTSPVTRKIHRQTYMPPFDWKGENETFRKVGWTVGHWLGTDSQGKDVLARVVYGFRISLLFGLALAFSGALIGTFVGALQGYFGGWADLIGQRATEIWAAIPQLFLLMILSKFMSDYFFKINDLAHYVLLFGILNLTAWMGIAAYMRAEFLRARNLEYVKAARALGLSNFKIMTRHILPNSLTPIVTFLPFNVSAGILALVSLDFLGFGVKYPAPSLGELLLQGQQNLAAWWIILPTFLMLALTLVLLTFIGEGVRAAFDPRAK